jgi:hypothetical protein
MGRNAIALLTIGNKRYVHYVGRNTIRWHLVGKIKPCDTRYVYFKGGMAIEVSSICIKTCIE